MEVQEILLGLLKELINKGQLTQVIFILVFGVAVFLFYWFIKRAQKDSLNSENKFDQIEARLVGIDKTLYTQFVALTKENQKITNVILEHLRKTNDEITRIRDLQVAFERAMEKRFKEASNLSPDKIYQVEKNLRSLLPALQQFREAITKEDNNEEFKRDA